MEIKMDYGKIAYEKTKEINRRLDVKTSNHKFSILPFTIKNLCLQNGEIFTQIFEGERATQLLFCASLQTLLAPSQPYELRLMLNGQAIYKTVVSGASFSFTTPFLCEGNCQLSLALFSAEPVEFSLIKGNLSGVFSHDFGDYSHYYFDTMQNGQTTFISKQNGTVQKHSFEFLEEFYNNFNLHAAGEQMSEHVKEMAVGKQWKENGFEDYFVYYLITKENHEGIFIKRADGLEVQVCESVPKHYTLITQPTVNSPVAVVFLNASDEWVIKTYSEQLVFYEENNFSLSFQFPLARLFPIKNKTSSSGFYYFLAITTNSEIYSITLNIVNDWQYGVLVGKSLLAKGQSAFALLNDEILNLFHFNGKVLQHTTSTFYASNLTFKRNNTRSLINAQLAFSLPSGQTICFYDGFVGGDMNENG